MSDEERRLLVQILDALPNGDDTGPARFEVEGPGDHPLHLEAERDQRGDLVVRLVGEG
jgi:hypothetical protein